MILLHKDSRSRYNRSPTAPRSGHDRASIVPSILDQRPSDEVEEERRRFRDERAPIWLWMRHDRAPIGPRSRIDRGSSWGVIHCPMEIKSSGQSQLQDQTAPRSWWRFSLIDRPPSDGDQAIQGGPRIAQVRENREISQPSDEASSDKVVIKSRWRSAVRWKSMLLWVHVASIAHTITWWDLVRPIEGWCLPATPRVIHPTSHLNHFKRTCCNENRVNSGPRDLRYPDRIRRRLGRHAFCTGKNVWEHSPTRRKDWEILQLNWGEAQIWVCVTGPPLLPRAHYTRGPSICKPTCHVAPTQAPTWTRVVDNMLYLHHKTWFFMHI